MGRACAWTNRLYRKDGKIFHISPLMSFTITFEGHGYDKAMKRYDARHSRAEAVVIF